MNEKIDERTVYVDTAHCTGCGVCVEVCPTGAIRLVDGETGRYAEVRQSECRGCEVCVEACPEGAISRVEREDGSFEYISDDDICIGCSVCAGICPCGVWAMEVTI